MKTRFLTVFVTLCISVAYASNSRYRVMFREDPATSMVIGWDQTGGSNPVVYYDIVDHGTNVGAYSNSQSVSRSVSYKGMNNSQIIQVQLSHFKSKLNEAINKKTKKLIVIHGKGKGVLKAEIVNELNEFYPDFQYNDASFQEFGYNGATEIILY